MCVGHFGEGEGQGLQEQGTLVSLSLPFYSHFITIAPDRGMASIGCHQPFLESTESFWIQKRKGSGRKPSLLCACFLLNNLLDPPEGGVGIL